MIGWPALALEIATFFAPYVVGALLTVAALSALFGRRKTAAAFAALCVLALARFGAAGAPPTAAAAGQADLRLLSANVLFSNRDTSGFVDLVAETAPDVVVMQEANFGWREVVGRLPGLPHVAGLDLDRWNGVVVASRWPLRAGWVPGAPRFPQGSGGGRPLRAEIDMGGKTVVLYAVHCPTPRSPRQLAYRDACLAAIAAAARSEAEGATVLVVGDWNTPSWSPVFAETLREAGLASADRGWPANTRVFGWMSAGGFAPIGTPIDHVAVSPNVGVASFSTGRPFGSDHLPVVASLKLPG